MKFTSESFFNAYLPVKKTQLDAILTLTSSIEKSVLVKPRRLVIFVGDVSSSMQGNKLAQMKAAIHTGIDCLDDDTLFSVITFGSAEHVWIPATLASNGAKQEAHLCVERLRADGGTYMSRALYACTNQAKTVRVDMVSVYFVTDGENAYDDSSQLDAAIEVCRGLMQVNCWGVGTDWAPNDLRRISTQLMGSADAVPNPEALKAKFQEALSDGMSKSISNVRLRLWTPATVQIKTLKQMSPEIVDLMGNIKQVDEKTVEVVLGAFGSESRDYHVQFEFSAQAENEQLMVCRPKIVYTYNNEEFSVDGQRIVVTWSSNEDITSTINAQVAHYTGQEELALSIKEGLEAKAKGNLDEATLLLGKAAKIASETGNDEVTQRLKKVVDVIDIDSGTVRLRKGADKGDDMELDMGGTRTVRRNISIN